MTWYFDPAGTTMDVYDHDGTLVAADVEFGGSWSGEFPPEVLDVGRDSLDNTGAPTSYNQKAIADLATEQIEQGTPP